MKDLLQDRFVLISRWRLDCAVEPVWQRISRVQDWPQWWPQVRAVQVEGSAPDVAAHDVPRVGRRATIEWTTPFGYGLHLRVTTTRVAAPYELEGVADGDLEGHGLWLLDPRHGDGVLLTYRWDVHLNRRWMRLTSPLLRPLFARNHASVMRAGASGMAGDIGCRLLHCEDLSISPGTSGEAAGPVQRTEPSA